MRFITSAMTSRKGGKGEGDNAEFIITVINREKGVLCRVALRKERYLAAVLAAIVPPGNVARRHVDGGEG